MVSARTAGIKVSGTVILGLGGAEYWKEHIDGTLALLSEAPLTYLSTLQLFLEDTVRQEFAEKFGSSENPFSGRTIAASFWNRHAWSVAWILRSPSYSAPIMPPTPWRWQATCHGTGMRC